MPSKNGFQLTEGDREILTWVYQCQLVTIDHLGALTGRSRRALNRRLLGLSQREYLYRKRDFFYDKYTYTINNAAIPVLSEQGIASAEAIILHSRRLRENKPLFRNHELMLSDIHVSLILASRGSPIELALWKQGRGELKDSVTVFEEEKPEKLPVEPDAFFVLEDTRQPTNRAAFFLEADRSTTTNQRFKKKIRAYEAYFRQGLHTEKYGIRSARVLTLTLREARALNLCAASRDVLPSGVGKFYYFAPVQSATRLM